MTPKTLLDTDVLSALMRKNSQAIQRAKGYLADHSQFTFSAITRYEILRGLKAKNAQTQLSAFHAFCSANEVLPVSETILDRTADLYADLHRRGQLIPDADLLIAATALEHGLILSTNNIADFGRITGLTIDNWQSDSVG
ncbi:MAG: type II toxin-antitoxin system VapC family toxin [Pirellulales bacterium]|nr:type II toxin-antitoxin system VapC family toxin [Pirellulales bacterium]